MIIPLNRQMILRLVTLLFAGLLFDSSAVYFNWIQLNPPAEIGWLPIWMISLWLLFISSMPLLQSLFQNKYFLAAIAGAVFGPLSYQAGAKFGVLHLNGAISLVIYSVYWAIYIPSAIFWLRKK